MALFMEEETQRLRCHRCSGITFYERPIYGYIKNGNDLISTLDKTVIMCSRCDTAVHEVKAGKGTIIR